MLLQQILNEEPPPLRKLDARIPRDVETICAKCLEKDPARRYPSAAELSAELRRWLTGHPILARPVSRVEHAWRWCRRNPAVASLSTTVALVLLIGMAVSWFFASQSSQRANDLAKQQGELLKKQGELTEETKRANRNLYAADMNLAQMNWENNLVGSVLDRLERHRPKLDAMPKRDDVRGFEWYYWDRLCHSSLLDLKGHTSYVTSVAFSPDGQRLASASWDNTVKVWDARPWTPELRLEQEVRCLLNSVIAKAPSREALLTAIRASKTFSEPARNLALQKAPATWTARQRQHSRE